MSTTTEERVAAVDPDKFNWNDANAYAAIGIGEDEPEGESGEQVTQGETRQAAPAASPAPAAQAPAAAPAPSATPGAAAQPETERIDGIATRDGKHVIPYAVLQQTREALAAQTNELTELRAKLAKAGTTASQDGGTDPQDLQARAEQGLLTEEERVDFPALAKLETAFMRMAQGSTTAAPAAHRAAPAPAPAAQQEQQQDSEEDYDLAIVANPLIGQWMATKGPEWQRAVAVDQLLRADPKNADLTYTQRFAKVQRMVAAEFEIPLPAAAPKPNAGAPAPTPAAPAPAAKLPEPKPAAMPSLSDMGGTAPQSEEDAVNSMSSTDLLAAAEKMTDEQLMRMAGVRY